MQVEVAQEMSDILRTIQYKHGWSFSVEYEMRMCHWILYIRTAPVPDANTPAITNGPRTPLGKQIVIPEHMPASEFYQWFRYQLMEIETHELDEWYRINGKRYSEPHN